MTRSFIEQEKDPERLRAIALAQESELRVLYARISELVRDLADAKDRDRQLALALELRTLQERLDDQNRDRFGTRSERRGRPDDAPPKDKPPKDKQPGHGPTPQLKLPIDEVEHTLGEDEQGCRECGDTLDAVKDWFETSEEVTVIEREYRLIRHKKQKYRCPTCRHLQVASAPPRFLPGGRYSADFVVEVALEKYLNHQPLARQVRSMKDQGLQVTTQTLWDQLRAFYQLLLPSYLGVQDLVLNQDLVHADETTWRMMGRKGRKGRSKKWWCWVVSCEVAAFYAILPTRGQGAAHYLLQDFDGVVVADGYGAYAALEKAATRAGGVQLELGSGEAIPLPDFTLAICWMHARRPLFKAEKNYPQASEALDLIAKLYAIEAKAREQAKQGEPLLEARARLRAEEARPVIEQLRGWRDRQRALPGTKLYDGVSFLTNQWTGLTRFLDNPLIPLDNGEAERRMRGPVIGRKNHQGSRSEEGARVSALFYTLLESCRIAGVDPRRYLRVAMRRALENPGAVTLPHLLETYESEGG